jgi:hypothetical protein
MNKNTVLIVLGVVALIGVCLFCGLIGSFQTTQGTLIDKEQLVQRGESQYGGALDIVTQKITGAFSLADRQIAHEDRTYQELAEAYKAWGEASQSGTPVDQLTAAAAFNLKFQALTINNPEFASAEVVQDAMNAMEEAINEVFTAFQDWQDAILGYNSYRGKLFMPLIVGDLLGFPRSFEYYEAAHENFNIQDFIPTTQP